MLNREIYNKLPSDNHLVNNGVAEVSEDHSESALSVLRYELETFVCDGQYEKGLETVLDKFLHNLGSRNEQPGIWISGFYGSGKSHLAKMLRTLWTDYKFSDGALLSATVSTKKVWKPFSISFFPTWAAAMSSLASGFPAAH